MIKSFKVLAALCSFIFGANIANSAEVTLTLHHFLGVSSDTHARFIEPWVKDIEAESKGRIKIKIFPAMSLGGKPSDLYRQARDGVADIVWTLPGYSTGVFPRSEVFELPSFDKFSAVKMNLAIQKAFPLVKDDFKDFHTILLHAHAGHMVAVKNRLEVNDWTDKNNIFKGIKLRTPSRVGAWTIKSLGAIPVGMPLPELPQSLSKGVVEGAMIPFEVYTSLGLHDIIKLAIEPSEKARFGTAVFLFIMNKDRYNSLPADLKAIIDNNSGMAIAEKVGEIWEDIEQGRKAEYLQKGGKILKVNDGSKAMLQAAFDRVKDQWIEEMAKENIDGEAIYKGSLAALNGLSVKN